MKPIGQGFAGHPKPLHTFSQLFGMLRLKGLRYEDSASGNQPTTLCGPASPGRRKQWRNGMIQPRKSIVETEDITELDRAGVRDVIIELLRDQALFSLELNRFTTPLHLAMTMVYEVLQRDVVAELLTQNSVLGTENHDKNTALHLAVANGATAVITQLLAAGSPVNAAGKKGQSPLHFAISIDDEKVALRVVKALLAAGADVGARDHEHNTALHIAMVREVGGIITELLLSSAPINEAGWNDKYPLHIATTMQDQTLSLNTVSKLLREGAIIDAKDRAGSTALHLAIQQERIDLVKLLIENKADVNAPDKAGITPQGAAMRLSRGFRQEITGMLEAAGAVQEMGLSLATAEIRSRFGFPSHI